MPLLNQSHMCENLKALTNSMSIKMKNGFKVKSNNDEKILETENKNKIKFDNFNKSEVRKNFETKNE